MVVDAYGVQLLPWLTTASYLLVALLALRSAWREPDRPRVTLATALSLLVISSVAGRINFLSHYRLRAASDIGLVAFAASGVALVEFRATIVRLSPRTRFAAAALLGSCAAFAVAVRFPMGPQPKPVTMQLIAVNVVIMAWSACVFDAAWRFWRAAAAAAAIPRMRLRMLALSFVCSAVVLVFAGLLIRLLGDHPALVLLLQLTVVLAAPGLYFAVAPPRWIRLRWLRRSSERRARSLVQVGSWYWDIPSGLFSLSPDFRRMLGLERRDVLASKAALLARIHPDDRDVVESHVAEAPGEGSNDLDYRVVSSSGQIRWLHGRREIVLDPASGEAVACLGTAQDITERKLGEQALHESDEQLRLVLNSVKDYAIFMLDAAGRVASWSSGAERLKQWTSEEIIGRDLSALYLPEDVAAGRPRRVLAVARKRGTYQEEAWRVRKDGSRFWADVTITALFDPAGSLRGYSKVTRDATERHLASERLQAAYAREREAAEQLRALDQMKDSILVAVSHELRTPLAIVLGLAETLRLPEVQRSPAHVSELVNRLQANADRLGRLLGDLLDIDRLSRGVIAPRRRPTDVSAVVRRMLEALDLSSEYLRVELAEVVARIDQAQLERIVENLLANAAKYAGRESPIWLRTSSAGGDLLLEVSDGGPGVPDDLKLAIFEPFRRGQTSHHVEGTGIGLALVARFAELHGGRAWVADTPGGGASFRVLFPDCVLSALDRAS